MTGPARVAVLEDVGFTLVIPDGRLFFDTVGPLREALLPLAALPGPRLLLDLSHVSACDSSALNLMVRVHQLTAQRAGWLRIAGPQPHVRRALEVTNLTRLLAVYDSVADAARDGGD